MGKRSIKTTKSGKFMNPTDQWRKESRRKELRKNKKQRQAVREAVLRAKDPRRMLREIEEIEKVEADAGPVPLPNEKSLKEKKRKLEETLSRVVTHFERDDPKKAGYIRSLITDSESKRRNMAKVFRDYETARSQIDVSDIPLPGEGVPGSLDSIPLPGAEG
jgi:WW domain-binding protein 11